MGLSERSGSINYLQNSSSAAPFFIDYSAGSVLLKPEYDIPQLRIARRKFENFSGSTTTNTIIQELTVKYFQRVYDAGRGVYCYYTKTSIDATPSAGETTPNYTGAISDHSVIKILEIY